MADSPFRTALDEMKTLIDALSLTYADSSSVECTIRKRPFSYTDGKPSHWFPGITLSQDRIKNGVGTNQDEDRGYGVRVSLVGGYAGDTTDDQDRFLDWEQQIADRFDGRRITNITTNFVCWYEPAEPLADQPAAEGWEVSEFVIRVWCRELIRS